MKSEKLSPGLWLGLRCWIGLIFAYAGWSKVIMPVENFQGVIAGYEILPYSLVPLAASVIPWVELLGGIFLICGYLTRGSAFCLSLLSLGFMAMMAGVFLKTGQFPADCGCFGEDSIIHLTGKQVLLLDAFNCALGLRLSFMDRHLWSLDGAFISKKG